ncbi:hypothetical protein GCM10023116_16050 [Kistimonas scapharcae]|uniref:Uncharacterized protein n=1 Tax=Kistimonas scapharcae TaxID=1036133 RepID=A0ABP8V0C8_9GAMM
MTGCESGGGGGVLAQPVPSADIKAMTKAVSLDISQTPLMTLDGDYMTVKINYFPHRSTMFNESRKTEFFFMHNPRGLSI